MAALLHFLVVLLAAISVIGSMSFPLISAATNTKVSNVLDLVHRDSPLSPLHNPLDTNIDRLRKAFDRSLSRINHFKPMSVGEVALQSDIVPSGGEYFMRISIGNPLVQVLAIADTGSDLTWVQCQPCEQCYKQDGPIYDPRRSSTYHAVLCGTESCNALDTNARSCTLGLQDTCQYTYSYGDHSFTNGKIGTEKLVISNDSLPLDIIFGCGTSNGGTFDEVGSGIVGLGGGSLSLVSQLGNRIGRQFSYCLVPTSDEAENITSKIKFGSNSTISVPGVASTSLVSKDPNTYYYLTLEAISVGNKRLAYKHSWDGSIEKGNIIIDSGTTLTFLDSELFDKLEAVLEEAVRAKRVSDPKGSFSICFQVGNDIELPIITVHFTGADVKLKPLNAFVKVEDDLVCLSMIPSNDIAIFGNLAQMNFEVGYDLEKRVVSFLPADCTNHKY